MTTRRKCPIAQGVETMPNAWSPDELQKHLDQGNRVFVKVWQKGCGPCKMSSPAVERIESENKHNLIFGQICLDDHPEFGELANVDVMPTFFVFVDKEMKGRYTGFKGIAKLQTFLDETLQK